ncbi:hypothetical protein Btru_024246 [Bulinus truncatus]|nr:hypothetical protein Btru_024246 [Bulinus truncatus]
MSLQAFFCSILCQNQEWAWLGGEKNVDPLTSTDYPGGRSGASVLMINETVFMFGGNGFSDISTGIPHLLNDLWVFDTKFGKFQTQHPGSLTANVTDHDSVEIPEIRQHAAMCGIKDKLFLFGGFAKEGHCLSDLWTYDFKLSKWTGISNLTITPSKRGHSAVWCYNSSLYLFGGMGEKAILNDMWVFNLSSFKWKELHSLKNLTGLVGNLVYPWGRNGAATWVSGNDFYMFGGNSNPMFSYKLQQKAGLMSDLWKYSPYSNEWYYVSGPTVPGQVSILNGVGTAVDSNLPGSRIGAASWTDSHGHLWLFAGTGADVMPASTSHTSRLLADLWRFHLNVGAWAFMGGSKIGDIQGNYDSCSKQKHSCYPGARTEMMVWKTKPNKAVIFGGVGHDGNGFDGYLNDLWSVDFSANTENEYQISTLSLLVFMGLGSASLFVLLILIICSKQDFATTASKQQTLCSARKLFLSRTGLQEDVM